MLGFSRGPSAGLQIIIPKKKTASEWYFSGRICPVVTLAREESEAQFEISNWFLEHYKDFTVP